MNSDFLQTLWKLQEDFRGYPALACIWEGMITCFEIHIPFNDALIQTFFLFQLERNMEKIVYQKYIRF